MSTRNTVLVADDDPTLRTVLTALLEEEGFKALEAADGSECLHIAYDSHPDLILLDIMMPNKDGREVCRRLREISNVPIIMLTALSTDNEKVDRFNDGADDYVTKPFKNDELIARIRALLRRTRLNTPTELQSYEDHYLRVDFEGREVSVGGDPVSLSPKEWRLIECLIRHAGRVVTRAELLRYGWGEEYKREFNYLKVYISHLRHKLGEPRNRPRYIHTERDLGYRFERRR